MTGGRHDRAPVPRPLRGRPAEPPGRRPALAGERVEGRQAVRELLRAGRRRVHEVLVAEAAARDAPVQGIVDLARARGVPVRVVSRPALEALAATEAPQGVLARADPVAEVAVADLAAWRGATPPFVVVLDGVTDPRNLGAVMRSALGAGATGIVIGRHRASGLTPAAVKAAAGAVEHLPVARAPGIPAALLALRSAGVWTVGLDAAAPASLWDLPVATEPVAVVLGAEGPGLSHLARDRCDLLVGIPLRGPLASLNVAAAATLACFEVARRRAAPPA